MTRVALSVAALWLLVFASGCGEDDAAGGDSITKEPIGGNETSNIGDIVSLETVDTEVELAVESVDDSIQVGEFDEPSLPGGRFVAVEIAIDNTGDNQFGGSLFPAVSLVTDADTEAEIATPIESPCSTEFVTDTQIAPGDRRAGCIVFEVPKRETPRLFQFSVDAGGGEIATAEWELR